MASDQSFIMRKGAERGELKEGKEKWPGGSLASPNQVLKDNAIHIPTQFFPFLPVPSASSGHKLSLSR